MRKALFLTAVVVYLGTIDRAHAQGPAFRPGPGGGNFGQANNPAFNPAVSPYMNLYRRGSSIAVNYYGLVRPAIDVRGAVQNLQSEINDLPGPGTGGAGTDATNVYLTGSRTRFMTTGNYFLSGVPLGINTGRTGGVVGGGGSTIGVNPQQNAGAAMQGYRMGTYMPNTGPRR
jgi:hypothetical protein